MNADGAFAGPFEGEIVELFGKTASGGPRLMYDTRIAISNVTRNFCKNGGKPRAMRRGLQAPLARPIH
jgi:hypothetical protein